jgi:hypothetical protein
MEQQNFLSYKNPYYFGLVLCLLSFLIYFFIPSDIPVFFVNYGLTIVYGIAILIAKRQIEKPRPPIFFGCWINLVVLFTISAFSLNENMNVFAPFPIWMNVLMCAFTLLFLVYPFVNTFSNTLKAIIYLMTGTATIFAIYMFIFLIPVIPITMLACLFFGISLHTFVPLTWLLIIFILLVKTLCMARYINSSYFP